MEVIAIDDLLFADVGIPPAVITNESSYLNFGVERREGIAGSVFFGGSPEPATWAVLIDCPDDAARDALTSVLGGNLKTERRLLARDGQADDLVVISAALENIEFIGSLNTIKVFFQSSDSVWVGLAESITAKSFSSPLDHAMHVLVPGNMATAPTVRMAPLAQRTVRTATVGWSYHQQWTIWNTSDEPWYRFAVLISLGSTTALVSGGKAQADGDDVRVWLNGLEQARTLVDWNTSDSGIWVVIPALAPGNSITYDLVYGNPAAGSAPGLAYPDFPQFVPEDSTNELLVYDHEHLSTDSRGLYYLSKTGAGAISDFGVPGAWHPVYTFPAQENDDERAQYRQPDAIAGFFAVRAPRGSERDEITAGNAYDGLAIHHPLGITSMRAGFIYANKSQSGTEGKFVILARDSAAEGWATTFSKIDAPDILTTISVTDYPVNAKQLALAVWPRAQRMDPEKTNAWIQVQSNDTMELSIDTTNLVIEQTQEERQIYEIAAELRLSGGANAVPPYRALLVGNARGEAGPGTPRCAIGLDEVLVIDAETRDHAAWNADVTERLAAISAHVVRGIVGSEAEGETQEFRSSEWLPLLPSHTRVENGDFSADLSSWENGPATSGMTATLDHDPSLGGAQDGSLAILISPNSAGSGAEAMVIANRWRYVHGLQSIQIAAWSRTSNLNLTPLLGIIFYNDASDTPVATAREVLWSPVANTPYRRAFAARVPRGAIRYRLALIVRAATAAATGTVHFDDVTLNDNDLIVSDVSSGGLAVDVLVRGRRSGWR